MLQLLTYPFEILLSQNGIGWKRRSFLYAFLLVPGGSAKDTKRGEHLHDFVKRDAQKAEVRIHIDNSGEEAYRPEVYGGTIIFERIIQRAGGGSNGLRSSQGIQVYQGGTVEHG